MTELLGIKRQFTTPYHPQNGKKSLQCDLTILGSLLSAGLSVLLKLTSSAYVVDGDPAPSITWFRGNPLQPLTTFNGTVVNGTLIIQNVTEGVDSSATGVQYQCRASNSFGTILSKPINVSTSYFGGFQGPLSITYGEHNSECSG
eukprot:Em0005g7a